MSPGTGRASKSSRGTMRATTLPGTPAATSSSVKPARRVAHPEGVDVGGHDPLSLVGEEHPQALLEQRRRYRQQRRSRAEHHHVVRLDRPRLVGEPRRIEAITRGTENSTSKSFVVSGYTATFFSGVTSVTIQPSGCSVLT